MEINWRSTRVRTNDAIYLDIPNYSIARGTIVNLHYPTLIHAMRIRVGVDYEVPPNRVKDALHRAASSAEGVVPSPPVKVFVVGAPTSHRLLASMRHAPHAAAIPAFLFGPNAGGIVPAREAIDRAGSVA